MIQNYRLLGILDGEVIGRLAVRSASLSLDSSDKTIGIPLDGGIGFVSFVILFFIGDLEGTSGIILVGSVLGSSESGNAESVGNKSVCDVADIGGISRGQDMSVDGEVSRNLGFGIAAGAGGLDGARDNGGLVFDCCVQSFIGFGLEISKADISTSGKGQCANA